MAFAPQIITVRTSVDSAQYGAYVLGEAVVNQKKTITGSFQYANAIGYRSAMVGHGFSSLRGDRRGVEYTLKKTRDPNNAKFASLSLLSTTGAILGRIRSDVQRTIIHSLEFTIVKGDCRDFVLELNKLPDFPLAPFAVVQIKVGDSVNNWFIGKITDQEDLGAKNGKKFIFKGEGLSKTDLDNLIADDSISYPPGTDVGFIVDDLARNQIEGQCFVRYNSSKVQFETGVLTGNTLQPGKSTLTKFIDALAKMTNCDWGVDGDGDFFFLPVENNTVRTFFVGYGLNDFTPRLNLQNIKNTIFLQRQSGKGSGGAGWAVASIKSDETSIAKYGKREHRFQAPGFFSNFDLEKIGDRILEDLKEPRFSGQANGYTVLSELDFIERGVHRFILPFDVYRETISEVEDSDEWSGDSGLTITDATDHFVFGASSVKVESVNGLGSYIQRPGGLVNRGKIRKIIIWIRSSSEGAVLKAGFGFGAWNQYTNAIVIPQKDVFFAYEWRVQDLDITKIDTLGIQVETNEAFTFWVDKIEFEVAGFPYYKMQSTKQTYLFSPGDSQVKMEFDRVPSKMEDYINNILALAEENRFVGEIR